MIAIDPPEWLAKGFDNPTLTGYGDLPLSLTCHFDGLCEPFNPGGVATCAFAVLDAYDDSVWRQFHGVLADGGPRATNNWAEWAAFGSLLRFVRDAIAMEPPRKNRRKVLILGDSMLVVEQFNGGWKINAPHLQRMQARAKGIAKTLAEMNCRLDVRHVYREQNMAADSLSEQAFYRYAKEHASWMIPKFERVKRERAKKKAEKRGEYVPIARRRLRQ